MYLVRLQSYMLFKRMVQPLRNLRSYSPGLPLDSSLKTLNPLLRLAAISGVEAALTLHIRRGDDLNARDGAGATPLILAASRRRKGAVRLLLDAGANPALIDNNGLDALAHAKKGGCPETIAMLTSAVTRVAPMESLVTVANEIAIPVDSDRAGKLIEKWNLPRQNQRELGSERTSEEGEGEQGIAPHSFTMASFPGSVKGPGHGLLAEVSPRIVCLDDGPFEDSFSDAWQAEEEINAPVGDETIAEVARKLHAAIDEHRVVDRDEDWRDIDLELPLRASPLDRHREAGGVSGILLAALREGAVPEQDLIDVCVNPDGTRNEDAERVLSIVVGELGALVVDWTGEKQGFARDPTLEEEREVAEAAEFSEDLRSGRNEPFRFYSRDIRGDLLEADEEIALSREIEEAGRAALVALAVWPNGIAAVLDMAEQVTKKELDAESVCAGPEPSSDEDISSREIDASGLDAQDEAAELDELGLYFVRAVAAVKAAQGNPEHTVDALHGARLTRGCLIRLAESADRNGVGADFVVALERQAVARDRMILSNLRLALSIAKKNLWSGMPLDDLVQEANIGLMKAVERFDWRRGFRFSTYATWWIRQQVTRAIADKGRIIRFPVHVHELARKILRERDQEESRLGRLESIVETARRIGASLAKTCILLSSSDEPFSLDDVESNTRRSLIDNLEDSNSLDPSDVAEHACLRLTLFGLLAELTERDREVVLLRFGLGSEDPMTLEEVGQRFQVTRERIRQIEAKVLRRLAHPSRSESLRSFLK